MPISIALALVFGVAAFVQVQRFQEKYGVLPWNGSPGVWGAAVGLAWWIFLIPVVALVFAERSARTRAAVVPPMRLEATYGGTTSMVSSNSLGFASNVTAGVGAAVEAPAIPPRWAPDPSGRHQYRWWDGATWTTSVNTNGVTSTDQP